MPLPVLVPMVVVAVLLVAVLSRALGGGVTARLDADTARARFLVDHPEARIDEVAVSADGQSALLWVPPRSGRAARAQVGLVFVVGDRFATRLLRGVRVERRDGGLRIGFGDFATPPIDVAIDADGWEERLRA